MQKSAVEKLEEGMMHDKNHHFLDGLFNEMEKARIILPQQVLIGEPLPDDQFRLLHDKNRVLEDLAKVLEKNGWIVWNTNNPEHKKHIRNLKQAFEDEVLQLAHNLARISVARAMSGDFKKHPTFGIDSPESTDEWTVTFQEESRRLKDLLKNTKLVFQHQTKDSIRA